MFAQMRTDNQQLTGALGYFEIECGFAGETLKAYCSDLEIVCEYAARQGLALIDATIDTYRAFIREQTSAGRSSATIARRLAAVRVYLLWVQTTGKDTTLLRKLIEDPKQADYIAEIINVEQMTALLAQPDASRLGLRDKALLELLYASGLRASEICSVLLGDMNFSTSTIRVKGKGGVDRIVPFHPKAAQAVKNWLVVRGECRSMTLFISATGHPLGRNIVGRLVKDYAAKAGIPQRVYTHLIRHCFASHTLSGGCGLRELQEMMGHASVVTTACYLHLDTASLKRTHALLGR